MPIPDFQATMLPLLSYASDGQEHKLGEAVTALSDQFRLTEEERNTLLPSGGQSIINNRVAWASTYMRKSGLLESTRRGHFRITPRGQTVLAEGRSDIDVRFLKQFPEFVSFHTPKGNAKDFWTRQRMMWPRPRPRLLTNCFKRLCNVFAANSVRNSSRASRRARQTFSKGWW